MSQNDRPAETFVSEPIEPIAGTADAAAMARGAPGLPARFRWRGREFQVAAVIETHRELGPCHSGSPEKYVRKHWFTFRTTEGRQMRVYCDRQPRRGKSPKARWWLFSVSTPNV